LAAAARSAVDEQSAARGEEHRAGDSEPAANRGASSSANDGGTDGAAEDHQDRASGQQSIPSS
jgi:hypothetical protein